MLDSSHSTKKPSVGQDDGIKYFKGLKEFAGGKIKGKHCSLDGNPPKSDMNWIEITEGEYNSLN